MNFSETVFQTSVAWKSLGRRAEKTLIRISELELIVLRCFTAHLRSINNAL